MPETTTQQEKRTLPDGPPRTAKATATRRYYADLRLAEQLRSRGFEVTAPEPPK